LKLAIEHLGLRVEEMLTTSKGLFWWAVQLTFEQKLSPETSDVDDKPMFVLVFDK
jgi:hypothetical protein